MDSLTMEDVIKRYFDYDGKTLFFNNSDSYIAEYGEAFLRWKYFRGHPDKIVIFMGTSEYEEVPVRICSSPKELNDLITLIVFGRIYDE